MTEEQKRVYDGLMEFYEANKGRGFEPVRLVEHMEPIFQEAGLRRSRFRETVSTFWCARMMRQVTSCYSPRSSEN